jgi:hypothetical protein
MNADKSNLLARLKLREPVTAYLRPVVDSRPASRHQQAQSWVRITARLDASRRRGIVLYRSIPVLALGVIGIVAVLWFDTTSLLTDARDLASVSAPSSDTLAPRQPTFLDLRLADGAEFERLSGVTETASSEPPRATFADGSTLTALTPDTVVEPLAMTERDVTLRLVSGTVDVSVPKGGSRKWTLEAGELSVEVVGTKFTVARTSQLAKVAVKEGIVLVRSPKLTDGAQRLSAGERVEVSLGATVEPVMPSFEALMQQADAARQMGDLRSASTYLKQILRAFPNDARTGVAAFQLALVTQQRGASAQQVVAAFTTALAKARGQSLRQDCYWRLVLALEHAGQGHQASERAEQSLREYPNGRYASELKLRLAPPPSLGQ